MSRLLFVFIFFICGYLFSCWMPIPSPFQFSSLFLGLVFNPVKVFAAAMALITAFISFSLLLRGLIESLKYAKSLNRDAIFDLFLILLFFISSLILFLVGETLEIILFFSFVFLYGMMTIVLNK